MRTMNTVTGLAAMLLVGAVWAQGGNLPPIADDAPIYGSQMMTQQERLEYRERMRAANTLEERERVRAQHHEQMKARARERGVTLPDEPPMQGGMGQGGGMGGGGMGGGRGGGR